LFHFLFLFFAALVEWAHARSTPNASETSFHCVTRRKECCRSSWWPQGAFGNQQDRRRDGADAIVVIVIVAVVIVRVVVVLSQYACKKLPTQRSSEVRRRRSLRKTMYATQLAFAAIHQYEIRRTVPFFFSFFFLFSFFFSSFFVRKFVREGWVLSQDWIVTSFAEGGAGSWRW
jgi:hypothetical protein